MNKPEYSDFHKFIASLGTILVTSAVLLPWLFLRETFDTDMTAAEIAELSKTAQLLIAYRQNTALWFFQNLNWISFVLFLFGAVALVSGLRPWWKKQKILDRNVEILKERNELGLTRDMTSAEKAVQLVEETAVESELDVDRAPFETRQSKYIADIQEAFRIENIVIKKLEYCFGSARVLANQKIGSSEVDALIRLTNKIRIIVEVKRAKNSGMADFQIKRIHETLGQVSKKYTDVALGQQVYGLGIIISDEEYVVSHNQNFEEQVATLIFTENEFANLDCADLKQMIMQSIR